jgi:2-oxoglutarate ferredoxin oxidoreductase subunit beta
MSVYPNLPSTEIEGLKKKDFTSDQEVRWCPGCGDYSVLANVQKVLPTLGRPKEKHVFISGIGCSSRFPYYMETYGMHSIHGRAPAIATGVKVANPDLTVWVITGDGDALSIGGNHLIHVVRRNVDLNILLFNNQIYGLTKGQYSPTSEQGKRTKSSPMGSLDYPFKPISVALGAHARFVARVIDTDGKNMQKLLKRAAEHEGASFIEITQNCPIFNDGAWDHVKDRKTAAENQLHLAHGEPMLFAKGTKGIGIDKRMQPVVIDVEADGLDAVLVHDETNPAMAFMLSQLDAPAFPTPLGVFRCVEDDSYDTLVSAQIDAAVAKKPGGSVQSLLESGRTWTVE